MPALKMTHRVRLFFDEGSHQPLLEFFDVDAGLTQPGRLGNHLAPMRRRVLRGSARRSMPHRRQRPTPTALYHAFNRIVSFVVEILD
jgi:hypothetical protein